ncbi:hypothetical protein Thimo_0997 [Thioflavicoccus mobilis 8321]|uniref:Sulfotransferase family n=1 Tax=Thioflavicoccus mobilis 8321 TaxID=765912 RepID=L0GWY2_9GAMM|nr:hypothetical protein [Thioflavicoccus mobilis]AGA89819.1 hypothetical protein Thimo_0997 [Thioflavicoccus mobilis 8321]
MIISHKYRFIFLKTRKTAGTSIELWLSQCCRSGYVFGSVEPEEPGHCPRNDRAWFNPLPEIANRVYAPEDTLISWRRTTGDWLRRRCYYNHIAGALVRERTNKTIWGSYWKWCVERAPEEKVMSDFYMQRATFPGLTFGDYLNRFPLPVNFPIYCDRDKIPLVDEIIDYRHLEERLSDLSARLGIPYTGLRQRAKAHYTPGKRGELVSLTEAQRRKIATAFAREVRIHAEFKNSATEACFMPRINRAAVPGGRRR